jgi:hypothetical protein
MERGRRRRPRGRRGGSRGREDRPTSPAVLQALEEQRRALGQQGPATEREDQPRAPAPLLCGFYWDPQTNRYWPGNRPTTAPVSATPPAPVRVTSTGGWIRRAPGVVGALQERAILGARELRRGMGGGGAQLREFEGRVLDIKPRKILRSALQLEDIDVRR